MIKRSIIHCQINSLSKFNNFWKEKKNNVTLNINLKKHLMKKFIVSLAVILVYFTVNAQDVTGKWKTIDDETGKAKSIVEIYKEGDKYYGKIVEMLTEENKDGICRTCKGKYENKNIIGLVILKDLVKDDDEYDDGEITDPKTGKTYSCYIKLETPDKLKVRGYLGFSLLGRTQYWFRVK